MLCMDVLLLINRVYIMQCFECAHCLCVCFPRKDQRAWHLELQDNPAYSVHKRTQEQTFVMYNNESYGTVLSAAANAP